MLKQRFGYYGLVVQPSFDEVLDVTKKPLRIPIPDRKAKRAALSFYRAKLLQQQQLATGYEVFLLEHALSDETVPGNVIQIAPSKSADDAVWGDMARHAQVHWETQKEQALRHRVDAEATLQMGIERKSALSDAYFAGKGNSILQGEVPLDTHYTSVMEQGPAEGYQHVRQIPRAAPHNLPQSAGHAAQREFPTFRALNMGQARLSGVVGGKSILKTGDSYESVRRASGVDIHIAHR